MKILIAGDFCPSGRIIHLIENNDFGTIFNNIKPIISNVDYSIVNLECPIVDNMSLKPISKCGPNLRCSKKAIESLKYTGFQCVTLANNHFRDFGDEGCLATLTELHNYGIDYVGGGANLIEAQTILYKNIKSQKVAIINICEHESSIATNIHAGSAPFEYVDVYQQILEARNNADYVIIIVHGGNEHYQLPSMRMKKAYRWFVDLGADAVINHHQHCFNGYEVYKGKPIFYGIGNFCFDNNRKRNSIWNEGFMVVLEFEHGIISHNVIPYYQCNTVPTIELMKENEKRKFLSTIEILNKIILSDDELNHRYEVFCQEMSIEWLFNLEPYKRNRLFPALYRRNLLPSFISQDKIKWLINFIECESQVSRLLSALYSKIK